MRHPCIICDDMGSYRHDGSRYACDCRAGQRLSVPSYLYARNQYEVPADGIPMTHPHGSPLNPASNPTAPTSPSSTKNIDTNQLVIGVSHGAR